MKGSDSGRKHIEVPACETCARVQRPANVVFVTKYWQVALAKDQAYLGRSYITLLTHKESLGELTPEEWQDFENLVKHIETGYEAALGSGRPFNWACMMNNAFQSANPRPHVHWHMRPRHHAPITLGGTLFTDPEYAHHYARQRTQLVNNATLALISAKIKAHL